MATRKREYAFHVKAKILFANPTLMPFPMEGIVVTNKEQLAKTTAQEVITKWMENHSAPIKEIRITSTKKMIKDFLIQPSADGN